LQSTFKRNKSHDSREELELPISACDNVFITKETHRSNITAKWRLFHGENEFVA